MGSNFKWISHAGMLIGNSRGDTNTCFVRKHCLTDNTTANMKDKKGKILESKGLSFIDFWIQNLSNILIRSNCNVAYKCDLIQTYLTPKGGAIFLHLLSATDYENQFMPVF